jgi:3-phenylpropionate/trans-cinnamate dioxygenase ferredoxin subunit
MAGGLYAFSNYCPHFGAELTGSQVRGDRVICWWHGSAFNLTTGEAVNGPATEPLTMYRTRVEGDDVLLTKRDDVNAS